MKPTLPPQQQADTTLKLAQALQALINSPSYKAATTPKATFLSKLKFWK
jgi:hypothetical protein